MKRLVLIIMAVLVCGTAYGAKRIQNPPLLKAPLEEDQVSQINTFNNRVWSTLDGEINLDVVTTSKNNAESGDIWIRDAETDCFEWKSGGSVNSVCTGAGGSANSFETMNAPSGTDPVADSSSDTLNFIASGDLTIVGDSATDTITITNTGTTVVPGSPVNSLQYNNAGSFAGTATGFYDSVNGRIGIGISNPLSKLEVMTTGESPLAVDSSTGQYGDYLIIKNNGYIGIGISVPNEQLEITKNFRMPATTATPTGVFYNDGNTFLHNFGTNNLFLGVGSGNLTLTTGNGNIGIGTSALSNIDGGSFNVAIGYQSQLKKNNNNNTSVGYQTLSSTNTTGNTNVAIGTQALKNSTSGSENVAVGDQSLTANTSGVQNTAVGQDSLKNNTTGGGNVAIGELTMAGNTTGLGNVAVGQQALNLNNKDYNVAVGTNAGENIESFQNVVIGSFSAPLLNTGNYNTIVGDSSGPILTTGKMNTFIGYAAGAFTGQSGINNSTCIGANCRVSNSNSIVLGASSVTAIGIGIMAPQYKLDVQGDINGRSAILAATSITATQDLAANAVTVNSGYFTGTSTGGNAGTTICIDLDNRLCRCGSCK